MWLHDVSHNYIFFLCITRYIQYIHIKDLLLLLCRFDVRIYIYTFVVQLMNLSLFVFDCVILFLCVCLKVIEMLNNNIIITIS